MTLADYTFKRNTIWCFNQPTKIMMHAVLVVFYSVFRRRRMVRFTSQGDGTHSPASKHYFFLALDVGARNIGLAKGLAMARRIQTELDRVARGIYYVVYEEHPAHFHLQVRRGNIKIE